MLPDKLISLQFKQGYTQISGCLYTVHGTHGVSTYTLVVTCRKQILTTPLLRTNPKNNCVTSHTHSAIYCRELAPSTLVSK